MQGVNEVAGTETYTRNEDPTLWTFPPAESLVITSVWEGYRLDTCLHPVAVDLPRFLAALGPDALQDRNLTVGAFRITLVDGEVTLLEQQYEA